MLFSEFQHACADRLMWDAWFGNPDDGLQVLSEDRMDLLHEYERRIGEKGICGVVTLVRATTVERGLTRFGVRLEVHEIPFINRGEGGTGKSAQDAACKAISLWKEWTPDEGAFSRLEFVDWGLATVDEANGRLIWALEMQTFTYLETVVQVLGDPASGTILASENNESLAVSPTAP